MTKGLATGKRLFQHGSQPRGHFRFDAEKRLERRRRLVHQHPQAIDGDMPARTRLFQQFRLEREINDLDERVLM